MELESTSVSSRVLMKSSESTPVRNAIISIYAFMTFLKFNVFSNNNRPLETSVYRKPWAWPEIKSLSRCHRPQVEVTRIRGSTLISLHCDKLYLD